LTRLSTDQFTAVLNELPYIDESAERLCRAVSGLQSNAAETVSRIYDAIKDIGKHGKRLTDIAGRALGVRVPDEAVFREIANTFNNIMARKRAGTLQQAVAGEEFGQLLTSTRNALNQLTSSSTAILRELQSQAGILHAASGGMARIQSFVHSHANWLRVQDGLMRGLQGISDQTLFELRTAGRAGITSLREPWEEEQPEGE
jgi:hypothetical protein